MQLLYISAAPIYILYISAPIYIYIYIYPILLIHLELSCYGMTSYLKPQEQPLPTSYFSSAAFIESKRVGPYPGLGFGLRECCD